MEFLKHPQSQGAVEKFNNKIINKNLIHRIRINNKFNIINALNNTVDIYIKTIHSSKNIEPFKAFVINKKKDLNRVFQNIIKSQINENKNNINAKKGSKAVLCSNFILNGSILKKKMKKK